MVMWLSSHGACYCCAVHKKDVEAAEGGEGGGAGGVRIPAWVSAFRHVYPALLQ